MMTDKETKACAEILAKMYLDEQYPNKQSDGTTEINAVGEDITDAFIVGYLSRNEEVQKLRSVIAEMKVRYLEKNTDWMKIYNEALNATNHD